MWGDEMNRHTKGCKLGSEMDCCVTRGRQNQPEKSSIFGKCSHQQQ